MKRTLLVPGALLPAALAPEITRAIAAPRLAQRLRSARLRSEHWAAGRSRGAAHWSWLAQAFGLADPPATAPYAWRAQAGRSASSADSALDGAASGADELAWIAHCDPVHMAIARDHLTITDLGDAPLRDDEAQALLALANEAARFQAAPAAGRDAVDDVAATPRPPDEQRDLGDLRFTIRGGRWFVLSAAPLQLDTCPLDAVLGRSIGERLPEGAHARAVRILSNEIQMQWHASAVNAAREQDGVRTVNALWIHGGGAWQPLPPRGWQAIDAEIPDAERLDSDAAVLQGWQQAGAAQPQPDRPVRQLSLFRGLFLPYAYRSWDAWLAQLPAWEERLERELEQVQRQGAAELELVLCGAEQIRTFTLRPQAPWWQRWTPRSGSGSAAALLRSLAEAPGGPPDSPA